MTVAAVTCSASDSNVKYILGRWLQACDYNTRRLGSGGGIAELFVFLQEKKRKEKTDIIKTNNLTKLTNLSILHYFARYPT